MQSVSGQFAHHGIESLQPSPAFANPGFLRMSGPKGFYAMQGSRT